MKSAINDIFSQRANFVIVGLTGRLGSGCTTVANLMALHKDQLDIKEATLGDNPTDNTRKRHIIFNFFKEHWEPFTVIRVKDIITLLILQNNFSTLQGYLKSKYKYDLNEPDGYSELNINAIRLLDYLNRHDFSDEQALIDMIGIYNLVVAYSTSFKHLLENTGYRNYSKVYQSIGDNIRRSGSALSDKTKAGCIYCIADVINSLIKVYRKYNKINKLKEYFIIDAIRNPFEALYFKERYSSFYLFSIKCSEDDRQDRLIKTSNLKHSEIVEHDAKENPKGAPTSSYDTFVSQNIRACIEKSDIHLINKGDNENTDYSEIKGQIVKYVTLIQHPGLITPTDDEKLMQIAFNAKVNSGCISRQVGAVVTNSDGTIIAVGWNDSPAGQVSCLYRSLSNLKTGSDPVSFSEYEKAKDFKKFIDKKILLYNLPKGNYLSYCFKDMQNEIEKKSNQVYTRAIHAEEHAFLQIAKYGGQGVSGGTLYSTASPCELCSKKAYHLNISRIVYIEPYPGIAEKNILKSGENRPAVELYTGAVGQAYLKLYEPLLPYKDELKAYELDNSKLSGELELF